MKIRTSSSSSKPASMAAGNTLARAIELAQVLNPPLDMPPAIEGSPGNRGVVFKAVEREIYFKSHISLWEHSSHFRLIGRGVPSVSVVSQLMYKFLCLGLPQGKSPGPHVKDQELNPRPHTPRPAALPVKVEQWAWSSKQWRWQLKQLWKLSCATVA